MIILQTRKLGSHGKYIICSLCPLSRWTCAFTVYICTISFFPVHLKLDFLIFFFLCIQPAHSHFRGMAFFPSLSQIGSFDFFCRAFSLHICLFTRQAFSSLVRLKLDFLIFSIVHSPCTYAFLRGRHFLP